VLVAVAASLAARADAVARAEPGVTADTILLGGTAALSLPGGAAAVRGAEAYLKHVNARGGVHGRRLAYRVLDDGGDPARALDAARRLVEQDGVFALFHTAGTAPNEAIRPYLNGLRVPQLFADAAAASLGRDFRRFPWTIGFRPSHEAEGWIHGAYLARAKPAARVAVLFQDDADGRELLRGLRGGSARSQVTVVAARAYDAAAGDVHAELAALQASGADTLALFARAAVATRAGAALRGLAWRPLLVTSAGESTLTGAVSLAFVKDPGDPRWARDPGLRLYGTILGRHAPTARAADVRHVHGMAAAYELVRVLRAAGPLPTRGAVMAQTRKLRGASNPFLLPGIRVETSATERFPLEQAMLQRRTPAGWRVFGGLWSARG